MPEPKSEFSRGWKVLIAAFAGIGVSMVSLLYYSSGVFIKPIEEEFGWTRAEIGAASLVSVIALALTAPFAGMMIDRFGLRRVTTISLLLYAGGVFLLTQMKGDLLVYYAIVAGYTIVGVASSPVAFTRAVTAFFDRNRGLALGLALTSTGIAGVLLPRYLTPYVAEHGWRAGYLVLGFVILAAIPLVAVWIRDRPDDAASTLVQVGKMPGETFAEAIRQRTFWTLGAIFFLIAFAVGGLIVSFIPLLQDAGMSPVEAGGFGALIGLAVMGGRLITGVIIDRVFAPHVTAVIFLLVACGCLALGLGGVGFALVAAIALGFAMGAEVDLIGYFTAKYFGLRSYGQIYGAQYSLFVLGSGFSPLVAGWIYDVSGSYASALTGAAVLLALASILSLTLGRFPAPGAVPASRLAEKEVT